MQPENEIMQGDWLVQTLGLQMPDWFHLMGMMAWPLAFCALFVMAISIERLVFHLRLLMVGRNGYRPLHQQLENLKSYPKALRDEQLSFSVQEVQRSCYVGIGMLRTIAVISPLLGLLGTILGIISAFKVIAAQEGPVSPNLIADGLWEAMLTTAAGMLIALPAIIAAYLFKLVADYRVHRLSRDLNAHSFEIETEKYQVAE